MNEWNIREKDLRDPHEPPAARAGRVGFCPTCKRPFLRGAGVVQRRETPPGASTGAPEPIEYCSERCLPARLA